jgi:2',3'-cyclic-nucleotide 2'-phosphodiesterase (5'-nucleotidase family)
MAETKIIMRHLLTVLTTLFLVCGLSAQEYSWKAVPMDGSRTGCRYATPEDIDESIGKIEDGAYTAPNGRKFRKNSDVAEVASVVLAAQPVMAAKKEVIGYSDHEITEGKPESELSNLIIDLVMGEVSEVTGKPVHIGILNFGGIRSDLPAGNILLDDVESMLPFVNYLVYLEHKGSQIRKILESMAPKRFQVLGGVKIVVEDNKISSIEIAGEPLDDEKTYGMASITFLLEGGDGLHLAENAQMIDTLDAIVNEPVLRHIRKETAAGRKIGYRKDGRITIRK